MSPVRKIERQALRLDQEERAELAKLLLLSLDESISENTERIWAEEAERRFQDLKAGNSETIPSSEVLAEARAKLR